MGRTLLQSRESRREALVALLGAENVEEMIDRNWGTVASTEEGRLCRRLYLVEA